MAIIPISSLPAATQANLTDLVPVDQGGTTKKETLQQILTSFAFPFVAGSGTGSAQGGDGSESAAGDYSFAFGNNGTGNTGVSSFSMGNGVFAGADYSFSFGLGSSASGVGSVCFSGGQNLGNSTSASAPNSFAMGSGAMAQGRSSFSFGGDDVGVVQALGDYSFAMGFNGTQTSNTGGFAFGNQAVATAPFSFCFGDGSASVIQSNGEYSFAFGNDGTKANGTNSFAFGTTAIANNNGSWVINDGVLTGNTDLAAGQFVLSFTNGYTFYGGLAEFAVNVLVDQHLTTNNNIVLGNTISTAYTATSTILSADLYGGILDTNPSAIGQVLTLPAAVDMDTLLFSITGISPIVNFGFNVRIVNRSATNSIEIDPGTNFTIYYASTITILPSSSIELRVQRTSNVPEYILT